LKTLTLALCLLFITAGSLSPQGDVQVLQGPFLGQKPPGLTPELFAPGIVSTVEDEYAFEISPDGNEMMFVRTSRIMLARKNEDGTWSGPAVAPFSGKDIDGECCFSPDGARIIFTSRRPLAGAKTASNVWFSEKSGGVWGKASPLRGLDSPKQIHAPSMAASGTIYDSGLIRFRFAEGRYSPAERITPPLDGYWPFVAPDESYIIFGKRPAGQAAPDLHIAYQKKDGTWTDPIRLDDRINTPFIEANSFVTAAGKYFFFSRKFDIYWVSADFIEKLRPAD